MRVTMIWEFPASYCHLARGITQVYLLYFFSFYSQNRKLCEDLADAIASSLEKAEEQWRKEFEASARYREVERIMERLEKMARRNKDAKHQ